MPKRWHWNAAAALGISPQSYDQVGYDKGRDFTCVGRAQDGCRCLVRRGEKFRTAAAELLTSLGRHDPRSEEVEYLISDIASQMLCRRHEGQARRISKDWIRILDKLDIGSCLLGAGEPARIAAYPAVQERPPYYRLSKCALWNPFLTMGLVIDDQTPCIGSAPSKGRACTRAIANENMLTAVSTLEDLSKLDPRSSKVRQQLPAIAKQLLCKRNHQDKHEEFVCRWERSLLMTPHKITGALHVSITDDTQVKVTVTQLMEPMPQCERSATKYNGQHEPEGWSKSRNISTESSGTPRLALPSPPVKSESASTIGLLTPPSSVERTPITAIRALPVVPKGIITSLPIPASSLPKAEAPSVQRQEAPSGDFTFSLPTPPSSEPRSQQHIMIKESVPTSSAITFRMPTAQPSRQPKPQHISKVRLPPQISSGTSLPAVSAAHDAPASTNDSDATFDEGFNEPPSSPPEINKDEVKVPATELPSPVSPTPGDCMSSSDRVDDDGSPFPIHREPGTPPPTSDIAVDETESVTPPYTPTRKPRERRTANEECLVYASLERKFEHAPEELHGHVTVLSTSIYTRPASSHAAKHDPAPMTQQQCVSTREGRQDTHSTQLVTTAAALNCNKSLPRKPPCAYMAVKRKPVASRPPPGKWESVNREPSPPQAMMKDAHMITTAVTIDTPDCIDHGRAPEAHEGDIEDKWKGSRGRSRRKGWRWLRKILCIPSSSGSREGEVAEHAARRG